MNNYKNHFLSILICLSCLLTYQPRAKAQLYEGIEVNSQLFTDNIWFFGQSWTGSGCPGVSFIKNDQNQWVAQNYSGKGQVVSWENSLSVSTPSCDGGFIFYTSNNKIYNSNHAPMSGNPVNLGTGTFYGNNSVADGLAACYIGNNKYFLFSNTTCYWNTIGLKYYLIDMSEDGGLGKITFAGDIEVSGMSESIEIIPVANSENEYWLVYHYLASNQMRVRKVTPSGVSTTIHASITNSNTNATLTNNGSFLLKSSPKYNMLALSIFTDKKIRLYDFNPVNGSISEKTIFSTAGHVPGSLYGIEFSPNGKYIYFASYSTSTTNSANHKIYQYDIQSNSVVGSFFYTTASITGNLGSGMKRGPNGKIYVSRAQTKYLGIIETPDLPTTDASFKYTLNGLDLTTSYDNLPLSTGITPPAKDPTNITVPPTTNPDVATTTNTMAVTVSVLDNDTHNNGNALHISSAFFTDPAKSTQGTVTIDATKTKVIFTPSFSYSFTDGEKVNITYVAKDNGTPIPMCNSEQLEITIKTDYSSKSTLFNDNVWFFGAYWSGPGCPAITFIKDGSNSWQPKDITATEGAQVKSWENSLSVSTPACDGNFVFYTSHDTVYNSNHAPMLGKPKGSGNNGAFWGHNSVADGLGACYVGNNKYFLFSSSTAHEDGHANIQLRYYIVDMSKDNGLGEIRLPSAADGITDGLTNGIIMNGYMSESLEVIPVPNTYDEYWLVYHTTEATRRMVVRKVTPQGIGAPTSITSQAASDSYVLKSNTTNTMLALSIPGGYVLIYNFNPATGAITYRNTFNVSANFAAKSIYGTIFSPNGRYLYVASYLNNIIGQYDLQTNTLVKNFTFTTTATGSESGSGMKLGPDGKIYVARSNTQWLGCIETPNLPATNAGFTYTTNAVKLNMPTGTTYRNLPLSTGLTMPAIDPPGTNLLPTLTPDVANAYTIVPTTVSPLDNDTYHTSSNATQLFLTKAQLVNAADAAKGTVTFNATTKIVTFTPNQSHTFTDGETIVISYTARDNQTPVGMCETSTITLTMKVPQLTVTASSPKQHNEGTKPTIQVCLPSDVGTRTSDLTVNIAQVTSTAPMATSGSDYTMPSSVIIPAASSCVTFEVDLKTDLLVEHNESLKIEVSATNCKKDSDELTIIDKTNGDIEIVAIPASVTEGDNTAIFQIRFKDAGVTCTWDVDVTFEVENTSTAISPQHYTLSPASPITIGRGNHFVNISVTTNANYVVEGNRDLKLKITSATPATP